MRSATSGVTSERARSSASARHAHPELPGLVAVAHGVLVGEGGASLFEFALAQGVLAERAARGDQRVERVEGRALVEETHPREHGVGRGRATLGDELGLAHLVGVRPLDDARPLWEKLVARGGVPRRELGRGGELGEAREREVDPARHRAERGRRRLRVALERRELGVDRARGVGHRGEAPVRGFEHREASLAEREALDQRTEPRGIEPVRRDGDQRGVAETAQGQGRVRVHGGGGFLPDAREESRGVRPK